MKRAAIKAPDGNETLRAFFSGKVTLNAFFDDLEINLIKTGIFWKNLHIFLFSVQNIKNSLFIFAGKSQICPG